MNFENFFKKKIGKNKKEEEKEVTNLSEDFQELKQSHGEEGIKKLEDFKKNLQRYQKGIAWLGERVLREILEKESLNYQKIREVFNEFPKKFNFSENNPLNYSYPYFMKALLERETNLSEAKNMSLSEKGELDEKKFFQKVFNFESRGEIKVVFTPISAYFRLAEEEDFIRICSGAYKSGRDLKKDDWDQYSIIGGACLTDYPNQNFQGVFLIENPSFFNEEKYKQEIFEHENQHSFDELLRSFTRIDEVWGEQKERASLKNKDNLSEEEEKARKHKLLLNAAIEYKVKGEIGAYFKNKVPSKEISSLLLGPLTAYEFGFLYNLPSFEEDDFDFDPEYMKMVSRGIVAFSKLLDQGLPYEKVYSILHLEPLGKWLKVAQRYAGEKISFADYKELEKKYIHPEIIKKIRHSRSFGVPALKEIAPPQRG